MHRLCPGAPVISHLLFANDTIIFCKATQAQAALIKRILGNYEEASGQKVDYSKTSIEFSPGTPRQVRDSVLITLDIREVLAHDKYLGLPTRVGRSKKKAFLSTKDRVARRLNGWLGKHLSWAGREVLVKAVAQAIPTYTMSLF